MAFIIKINGNLYVHRSAFRMYGGRLKITNNMFDAMRFTRKRDAENKLHVVTYAIANYAKYADIYNKGRIKKMLELGFDVHNPFTLTIEEVI